VRHDAEPVAVEGRPHGSGVDLPGVGGGRLQREVHEVEAIPADPLDFFERVAGRVVHRTDLHGGLPVDSIPDGHSTGEAGTMNPGRSAMPPVVLTVGHSNHPLDRFLALLARHGVEALVDIRRFPGSRKHPHFNRDNLAAALPNSGVEYHRLQALGGRRQKQRDESPNLGLENKGFRNYADYMLTDQFRDGVEKLLEVAQRKRTAILCAEGLFWQCHRRLVSDFLVAYGVTVQHIMPAGELRPHSLTNGAVIEGGRVTYPGERSLFA
jgi:hypothetical protein